MKWTLADGCEVDDVELEEGPEDDPEAEDGDEDGGGYGEGEEDGAAFADSTVPNSPNCPC